MIKKIIIEVDRILFNQKLYRFYLKEIVERKNLSYKLEFFNYGFYSSYSKNKNSLINKLCDKYGTDKGDSKSENNTYAWSSHNYADFYEILFRFRRKDIKLLIECGLGTNDIKYKFNMGKSGLPGASLKMWREFFPNARIIGVDIDKNILFNDYRIDTYYCDQLDSLSINYFVKDANLSEKCADIIIDDGLHEFKAGVSFFENMIKFLSQDGIYIIEDVEVNDMKLYKNYFMDHNNNKYTVHFINGNRPNVNTIGDNRLIMIFRNDY